MKLTIDKKMTIKELIKFALPSMLMIFFIAFYVIVDGAFVSRHVGSNALNAINYVFPVITILQGISLMFSTGGRAFVSKLMGENEQVRSKKVFTLLIIVVTLLISLLAMLGIIFHKPLITLLGGNVEGVYHHAELYLTIMLIGAPLSALQMQFQDYMIAANRPTLSLVFTIIGGVLNIILDYLFIVVFKWGISGAAIATVIGYATPTILSIIFFIRNKNGLHFASPALEIKSVFKSMYNGSSEMVISIASSITTLLFNYYMYKYLGGIGVSTITIILYAQFLIISLSIGFTIGIGSTVGYHYGARNIDYLKEMYKKIVKVIFIGSIILALVTYLISPTIAKFFSPLDPEVIPVSTRGLRIFAISTLFSSFNIFISGYLTSLSDGLGSVIASFTRTLIFLTLTIIIMGEFVGSEGLWFAIPVAEFLTTIFLIIFMKQKSKRDTIYKIR